MTLEVWIAYFVGFICGNIAMLAICRYFFKAALAVRDEETKTNRAPGRPGLTVR
jgi:hypothetical protein